MGRGEHDGERDTAAGSDHRGTVEAGGVEHRQHVVQPSVDGRQLVQRKRVRQPDTTPVPHDNSGI
jgi:hypothetical protein